MDYRWLIVGSLLPDVIDKPLGFWLAPELVNSSARSVAHTAIFAVLLLAVALTALRLGWSGMGLVPAAGSAGHLVLDQIWRQPSIALWPALGWAFPLGTATFGEWSESHLWDALALYRDPPELAGATVILLLAAKLWRDRAFRRFFGTGAVA